MSPNGISFPVAPPIPSLLLSAVVFGVLTSAKELNISTICPNQTVYSPFTPWPHALLLLPDSSSNIACWWWAECVIEHANEVRKQQFAATALVMGLIPLLLKDIAWPEKRIVHVPQALNAGVEVVVRGLGLIPVVKKGVVLRGGKGGKVVGMPMGTKKRVELKVERGKVVLVLLTLGLLVSYASLIVMEIYSKRSSLGCPYPVFVFTWTAVAIVPAGIETTLSRLRSSHPSHSNNATDSTPLTSMDPDDDATAGFNAVPQVQSGEQQWVIQCIWGIYYAAGTLIYSSIMAVTVIELVVWVIISFFSVGMSKLLAFRLCWNWR